MDRYRVLLCIYPYACLGPRHNRVNLGGVSLSTTYPLCNWNQDCIKRDRSEGRGEERVGRPSLEGQPERERESSDSAKIARILSPFYLSFYWVFLQNLKYSTNLVLNQIGTVFTKRAESLMRLQ